MKDKGFICPICKTHIFENDNTDEQCPICLWWNDIVQNRDPDYDGGENEMSQNEYRENWLAGKPVR